MTEVAGNMCLDVGVDLNIEHVEDADDVEAAPKDLLDLIDRHKRRYQPNIESPLEVNLNAESEPKVVFVGVKVSRDLKNQLIFHLIQRCICLVL